MRLNVVELPEHRATLRHWLTFNDGRIYFQDERVEGNQSTRGPWTQLPTPDMTWAVVGIIDHGGFPMAMLADGRAFLWSVDAWIPFAAPVPGSYADLG